MNPLSTLELEYSQSGAHQRLYIWSKFMIYSIYMRRNRTDVWLVKFLQASKTECYKQEIEEFSIILVS